MKSSERATRAEKVRLLTNQWRAFPNLTTLACYEYFSQTIHLSSVTHDEFQAAVGQRDLTTRKKVIPLFRHELTHWVDHITTLWGIEFLVTLFNAINVRRRETESELWRVVELARTSKRQHLADYYTHVYESGYKSHDGRPWMWQLSAGLTFDVNGQLDPTSPIAFTRFRNSADEDICRVPFSVASLLEVNATHAELDASSRLLSELDSTSRDVEARLFSREATKRLYDPLLAVYTVAAHLFANRAKTTNILTAYASASRVSGFCLNFPRKLFSRLVVPSTFNVWGEKNEQFKKRCDRGYLFMVLVEHAGDVDPADLDTWFDTVLERAGLPTLNEIRAVADDEMNEVISAQISGCASDRLSHLLNVGKTHHARHGLRLNAPYVGTDELVPPILLSDDTIITGSVSLRSGTFGEPEKWIDDAFRHSNMIRGFVEACLP